MKLIATKDLTGAALDWAVAHAEGIRVKLFQSGSDREYVPVIASGEVFSPSENWSTGGPILDKEKISIGPLLENGDWFGGWRAICLSWEGRCHSDMEGPTALVAAMRCHVAAKVGDEIEVPKELAG